MNGNEKIAYLKGLIEGSDFELGTKEKRAVDALMDTLTTMAEEMKETNARVDELENSVSEVFGTLEMLSHTLMHALNLEDDDDMFDDDDDDGMYDILCPNCGEVIFIDDDAWDDGSVVCYECGQIIELDDDDFLDDEEDDD